MNEEYFETFRTKSYIEICNKAQLQMTETTRLSSSTSSSSPHWMHLTEYLLEPRQETIANMTQSLKVHHLLVDYFEASLEACRYCDTILQGIHSMRLSYRPITRVVKLTKRVLELDDDQIQNQNQNEQTKKDIYRELATFAIQKNPLSNIVNTDVIHNRYMELLHRLTLKRGKIRRRLRLVKVCKKVGGIALVISHGAVLIALLVISFHSIVGLVAAPSIVGGLVGLFSVSERRRIQRFSTSSFERQFDAAAKGVYILINDLDTMSRMVKRLHDEVEHRKVVASVCVKKNVGKCEILKRVVSEFQSSFLEQLEELEEHIYLCFLTVNKSRRHVMQQIMDREED